MFCQGLRNYLGPGGDGPSCLCPVRDPVGCWPCWLWVITVLRVLKVTGALLFTEHRPGQVQTGAERGHGWGKTEVTCVLSVDPSWDGLLPAAATQGELVVSCGAGGQYLLRQELCTLALLLSLGIRAVSTAPEGQCQGSWCLTVSGCRRQEDHEPGAACCHLHCGRPGDAV